MPAVPRVRALQRVPGQTLGCLCITVGSSGREGWEPEGRCLDSPPLRACCGRRRPAPRTAPGRACWRSASGRGRRQRGRRRRRRRPCAGQGVKTRLSSKAWVGDAQGPSAAAFLCGFTLARLPHPRSASPSPRGLARLSAAAGSACGGSLVLPVTLEPGFEAPCARLAFAKRCPHLQEAKAGQERSELGEEAHQKAPEAAITASTAHLLHRLANSLPWVTHPRRHEPDVEVAWQEAQQTLGAAPPAYILCGGRGWLWFILCDWGLQPSRLAPKEMGTQAPSSPTVTSRRPQISRPRHGSHAAQHAVVWRSTAFECAAAL